MIIIETKTKQDNSVQISLLTERQYNLTTSKETLKAFRRFGGSETAQKCYTSLGYTTYKLTSKSPDKTLSTVREFKFYSLGYKEQQIYTNLFKSFDNGLFYLKRFKSGKTFAEVQKIISKKLN